MRLEPTPLEGVLVVEPERMVDERGFFARTYDVAELGPVAQMSASFNRRAGTLRGMHFQRPPNAERKLVRCTRGAVYDVAIDLREDSPTRHRWVGAELSAENGRALLVPEGFAHGFQTLVDETEVLYAMNVSHVPGVGCGVRWDDPAFGIDWPPVGPSGRIMAERDASYPDLEA